MRDAKMPYEVIVSDGLFGDNSPLQDSMMTHQSSLNTPESLPNKSFEERKEEPYSPLTPTDRRSEDTPLQSSRTAAELFSPDSSSYSSPASRRVMFNPQDRTPPGLPEEFRSASMHTPDQFPSSARFTKSMPTNNVNEEPRVQTEDSSASLGLDDTRRKVSEVEIQRRANKSLERLRNQRVAMERLKAESSKKDIRIQSLAESVDRLEKELVNAKSTIQNQSTLRGELAAAKEKIDLLESALKSKEHEMGSNLKKSKAMEELLRTSLRQEKEKREKDKSDSARDLSDVKTRLAKERQDKFNLRVQTQEMRAEINTLEANLVKEKAHAKKLALAHEERVATLEREISNLQTKEKQAGERLKKAQLVNEEQKEIIRNTQSLLAAAKEEQAFLQKSVKELESSTRSLRSKLIQTERKNAIEMENVKRKLQNTLDELNEKSSVCEKQKAELFSMQRRLDGETKAKNDATNMLIQRELELANANSLVERGSEQLAHAEEQLRTANDKVDQLHKRMLVEMGKASNLQQQLEMSRAEYQDWARARMHLLEKFCEEEERFS